MGEITRRKFKRRELVHRKCGEEVVRESVGEGYSVRQHGNSPVEIAVYKGVSGYRCSNCGPVPLSECHEVAYNVEEFTEDNPDEDELCLF